MFGKIQKKAVVLSSTAGCSITGTDISGGQCESSEGV